MTPTLEQLMAMARTARSHGAEEQLESTLRTLLARLVEAERQWQPIETAPKDGTSVLGFTKGKKQLVIFWHFNNAWHCDASYYSRMLPPTHWMPLPKPPIDAAMTGPLED